jgi:hypothetical protein
VFTFVVVIGSIITILTMLRLSAVIGGSARATGGYFEIDSDWVLHEGATHDVAVATIATGHEFYADVSVQDKLKYAKHHNVWLIVCTRSLDLNRPLSWSKFKVWFLKHLAYRC